MCENCKTWREQVEKCLGEPRGEKKKKTAKNTPSKRKYIYYFGRQGLCHLALPFEGTEDAHSWK